MRTSVLQPRLRMLVPVLTAAPLLGQLAPTTSDLAENGDEDLIVLSPFVVSSEQDTGYTAANTLAGSRINTELRDTPAAISVFTRDFIEDIGAINVNEAMEYALNASNDLVDFTGNAVTGNDYNYAIRGFSFASAGRNYFNWFLSSDSFNVERIDFSRGPNSILFGVGGPGGIVNTSTKRANIGRDVTRLQARVASWDDYRGTIDIGRSLGDKVAARLNVVWQDANGFRDWEMTKRKGAALATTFRPWKNTTIRLDGEWGDVTQNKVRPWTAYDSLSPWRAAGSPLAQTYGQTVAGTNGLGSRIVYSTSGLYANQAVSLVNFRQSDAPNLPGLNSPANIDDESIHPRRANIAGPGGETNFDYYAAAVYLEQRIGRDLYLEAAYNRQAEDRFNYQPVNFGRLRLRADANAVLPVFNASGVQTGTTVNPNAGKLFVESNHRDNTTDRLQEDYRFTASYQLDLGAAGIHRLAALAQRTESESESINRWEGNISPSRQTPSYRSGNNEVRRLTYLDLTGSSGARGADDPRERPNLTGSILGSPYLLQSAMYNRSWSSSLTRIDTVMAATQSSFLKDRVFVTAGLRRDRVQNYGSVEVIEAITENRLGAIRDDIADLDQSGNTRTLGGVVHATSWLSLYYNNSNNFQAQGSSGVLGTAGQLPFAGNVDGKGHDAGFKFRLLSDRVHAQVGWFETEEANRRVSLNGVYFNYMEGMWDALGQNIDLDGGDTRSTVSDGYELDVTANLTKQWRLSFNASKTENVQSNLLPNVQAYVAANRATWQAGAGQAVDRTRFPAAAATVGETLALLDQQIVLDLSSEGQSPKRSREYNANLFTNYDFDAGALKGFSVGFGAQYRGKPVLGYDTVNRRTLLGDDYILANGKISYSQKLSKRVQLKIQLNVDNLFDFDELQVLDSSYSPGTQQLYVLTSFLMPRRYSLTTTFSF